MQKQYHMEKITYASIERKVNDEISKFNRVLKYEVTDDSWTEKNPPSDHKNEHVYFVIYKNILHKHLAEKLNINDEFIQDRYKSFICNLKACKEIEYKVEFDEYLKIELSRIEDDKKAKINEYPNLPLIDQILDYKIYPNELTNKLYNLKQHIFKLKSSFYNDLSSLLNDDIGIDEYNSSFYENYNTYSIFMEQYNHINMLYDEYKKSKVGKYNYNVSKLFLYQRSQINQNDIEPNTISLCEFYLREYTRWYNKKFISQIEEAKKIKRNAKQKAYRNKKAEIKKKEKQKRDDAIIRLHHEGKKNNEIAEITGVNARTVSDIIRRNNKTITEKS